MNDPSSRRRFQRIPFTATATIRHELCHWRAALVDISLNGLLMTRPDDWPGSVPPDRHYHVEIDLGEDLKIVMQDTTITHMDDAGIGLACHRIDIDSIANLKRLIELNLGDPDLVHRELASLGASVHRIRPSNHGSRAR